MRKSLIFIIGLLTGIMLTVSTSAFGKSLVTKITATFNPNLPIYINGEKFNLEMGAINYKDTNYLSIREVAEATGLEVGWNKETGAVELNLKMNTGNSDSQQGSNEIIGKIQTSITVDGSDWTFSLYNRKSMIPSDTILKNYPDVTGVLHFDMDITIPEDYKILEAVYTIYGERPYNKYRMMKQIGLGNLENNSIKNGLNKYSFDVLLTDNDINDIQLTFVDGRGNRHTIFEDISIQM